MQYINWKNVEGVLNVSDIIINPSTEEKQDSIIDRLSDVQRPIPTDWDSVYTKDINLVTGTTIGTFTWDIESLFNDYDIEIADVSVTNPKTFTIRFLRPITTSSIWIWSWTSNFSNVKILLKDLSGTVRETIDDSSNNTKYTSNLYPFSPNTFIEMVVEFHTIDSVSLNGFLIGKDIPVVSRIQALKPDGTLTNIDATNWGNLKVSIEEKDSALDNYDTLIDDFTTLNKTYIGKAVAGALESATVWQIQCLDETWNITKAKFADWITSFTKEWDERTTYSYT